MMWSNSVNVCSICSERRKKHSVYSMCNKELYGHCPC